ncbi:ABC transporter ATP-binding protein [Colidextribacter sp. OB.20]|uniref:ribosomal protection-like ABC-F family protein n=1 Tax=Colidextribacter sp. OB.20 TaxID=2304568 RepID=UPI00136B1C21|nr:ATP-binding cassette domain-containing protein [Colidextribacter sp. OB.20]NBI09443.1 ABC transporter ATP-binding protein [Colidextribacter sp. OB.20]
MSQITIQDLHFTYDGDHIPVFEGLDLQLDTGWKLGLVGRNGRGKTTLLRLLAGELEGRGTVSLGGVPCLRWPGPVKNPDRRALDVLLDGVPPEEEWRLSWELSKLGLEEETLDRPFSTLSGGEQTRALLAALFLDEGAYPMVDEPTNHLDGPGRELVSKYLRSLDRGFLLVSHDRAFLDGCVDHILALNPSGPELVRGTFSSWFQDKEDRDRGELARNEKLKGDIRRLEQAAKRTSGWSDRVERSKYHSENSGLKVDRGFIGHKSAKMMQRAKNIEDRQRRAIEEKSALLKDIERADSLKLTPLAYHSRRLLEGRELAAAYPGMAGRPISFTLNQGDRLCLEGGNGSGKTSLLRLILGEEVPHTGTLFRASGLEISYVPQRADHLRGSPLDWAEGQGIDLTKFLTVLRKLDFSRALFERDMSGYSAGQKKKVLLAASLCHSAHLYLWDEPLNYIDLFSRIQLEELLLQYRPTLVFVEHDRVFRENIATRTVAL